MNQLSRIEEEIAGSRRYYNGVVNRYNTKTEMFPGNILASIFGFKRKPLYEVQDSKERENIKVSFLIGHFLIQRPRLFSPGHFIIDGIFIHRGTYQYEKSESENLRNHRLDYNSWNRREYRIIQQSFPIKLIGISIGNGRHLYGYRGYHTALEVHEDNSYTVSENINVYFKNSRHGIYRYIPYKGIITEAQTDGDLLDIPYYGEFSHIKSSETLDVTTENGNKVFRFGDEDTMVREQKSYSFTYKITPVTSKGYENAYYNVFPTGWRNSIPAGSSFTINFPADFDHDALRLYWGSYGEQKDASDITKLTWSGNTLTGVLKEELPVGAGMTFYAPMENGYFKDVHTSWSLNMPFMIVTAAITAVLLLLFFLFGRDTPIIPSVQFQPPAGLDSAAVGYIIDGSVSDEDITSLFVFWADRGFIKIRETKNKTLAFRKMRGAAPGRSGICKVIVQ